MAAQPVAPGLAPAGGTPASYRSFYNDIANDPFNGIYRPVLAPYDIPLVGLATQPAQIATQVYNASAHGTPTAFMVMAPTGMIHLYHKLSRFEPRLGQPATQWDDQGFANSGELFHNQPILVNWSNDHFHLVPVQIRAPTADTIDAAIAGMDPAAPVEYLGPYADGDAGTDVIRVRRSVYVPSKYVHILLETPLTPIMAWERLRGAIVNDGAAADCAPIITWLRAALTHGVGRNRRVPTLALDALPEAPVPDSALLNHRRSLLLRDFPHLDDAALASAQGDRIAQNLHQLVEEQRITRQAEAARRARDDRKDPSSLVGTQVLVLMRLCHVNQEEALPPIWGQLASCTKAQQLTTLSSAVNEVVMDEAPLVMLNVTPTLKDRVVKLNFRMTDKQDFASGIQPFIFGTSTPSELQEEANQISLYQTIFTDNSAPSVSDAQSLLTPKNVTLPRELVQARDMMHKTQLFLSPLLGPTHEIIGNLRLFVEELNQRLATLSMNMSLEQRLLLPVRITRWVQIRLMYWFERQWHSPRRISSPNFNEVFEKIELDEMWEPTLPACYLQEISPAQLPGFVLGGSGGGAPGSVLTTDTPVADGSTGGTADRGGTGGGAGAGSDAGRRGTMVTNPGFKAIFERFRALRINHGRLLRAVTTRPPSSPHDASVEMCLSYHVKGMCNENCGKAADHHPHTDAQSNLLLTWCNEHYRRE